MRRRALLHWLLAAALPLPQAFAQPRFAEVVPRPLRFPRDHGAHPEYRTEWWYVTGWLEAATGPLGFQITFFRSRTTHDPANPSRFAPHQLLFAHVALAQPALGRLRHDQRAARVVRGDETVTFLEEDCALDLAGWTLRRTPNDEYLSRIDGERLALELRLTPTQPLLLQGEQGYSQKGPQRAQASYYYSRPQLAVAGRISIEGKSFPVSGRAWLDHEWSSQVLDAAAAGWDWIGINLDDGGALMAFRIRARAGDATLWAAAKLRTADGRETRWPASEIRFEPVVLWRSPHTGARYPIRQRLRLGKRAFEIVPLMEDQELDARLSTGAVYWEGAVTLVEQGQPRGRGYLELVGYQRPMRL